MEEELSFRIAFWVLIALILLFNRILPALTAGRKDERLMPDGEAIAREGRAAFAVRTALGLVFFAYLLCYSFFPDWLVALRLPIPIPLRWLGVAMASIGVGFWIWSQLTLDRFWSAQLRLQRGHELVRRGPYTYVRHPIYAGMSLWALGSILFVADVVFGSFCVLSIVFLLRRIPKEERMMLEGFGKDYEDYMRTTGRCFPRLSRRGKGAGPRDGESRARD